MTKIVKSLSRKTIPEIESSGAKVVLSWEHIKGYFEVAGAIQSDEQLDGLIITQDDITLKTSKKDKL
jgi:hypothetical protein